MSQAGNPQALLADSTLSLADSAISQTGSSQSSQAGSSQSSLEDSTLSQSDISLAGSSHASPVDSTLSPAESELSQAGSTQSSLEDSTLQAESAVLPQAVRHSTRLVGSQARHIPQAGSSSRQSGTTPRVDSVVSQLDSTVPQVASPQAKASQEARSFPNRHNTPQGSSSLEEPNPKWVINLFSKSLTPA